MNEHLRWTVVCGLLAAVGQAKAAEVAAHIDSRRELFVDAQLIERLVGRAELRLHHPVAREVSLVTDEPWEGNGTNYVTVFWDGQQKANRYRMYYRGSHYSYSGGKDRPSHRDLYCYAESDDGIRWTKPRLGLFEWDGSKQNNIVWDGNGAHAFVPFIDANPACAPESRYKALGVGGEKHGLYAFQSADGIHWSFMSSEPVVTEGAFDSQNLAFWDTERREYREYHRDFRDGRDIRTATSPDFLHWTKPDWLSYSGGENGQETIPDLEVKQYPPGRAGQLYTNQILPYYRAPHIFLGFPTRYLDRGWNESAKALPRYEYRQKRAASSRREGTAITEGLLMTSRDGARFQIYPEAFLRPGLRTRDSWFYGDNYQAWGLVETASDLGDAPPELSLYVTERTLQEEGARLRRYTLRVDGFVSAYAPLVGGEIVTRPLVFKGNRLALNLSTSAAGGVRVELQDPEGRPLPGFTLADCPEIYGDDLDRVVVWAAGRDVSGHAGKPVRLRFVLRDADLYSYQFSMKEP